MASIMPFKGLHYNYFFKDISNLICPPYDIIKKNDVSKFLSKSPYNAIRLELPGSPLNNEKSINVRDLFDKWKTKKILVRDYEDSIYIYEMRFRFNGEIKILRGIICLVKIDGKEGKKIIPHENIFNSVKKDRFSLLKKINCNTNPIYSLFDGRDGEFLSFFENYIYKRPNIECKDSDGVIHRLWAINDKKMIYKISKYFDIKKLFIADGHHRYETALNYNDYCKKYKYSSAEYTMMLLVDFFDDNLIILPTHRVLKLRNEYEIKKLIKILKKYFYLENIKLEKNNVTKFIMENQENDNSILLYFNHDSIIRLFLKEFNAEYSLKCLIEALINFVFRDLTDENINHDIICTKNVLNAIEILEEDKENFSCAFFMPGIKRDSLMNIFLKGVKMPPKTTYFYPKPVSGVIMNEIEF